MSIADVEATAGPNPVSPGPSGTSLSKDGERARSDRPGRGGLFRRAPVVLLCLLSVVSLGTRAAWLDRPRDLIFDENYYVNAARTMIGLRTPPDASYQSAPGFDPNAEHPPLGKVFIAAGIKAFGDNPLGWRVASLVFGSAAILALYWMVRSAGGSQWLGVGAAAIMAADNLFLVHGRIATLDIFVLVFMLAGTALYLRKRPVLAGVVLGIGACTKLVGLFALVGLVVFELLRWRASPDSSAPAREQPALRSRVRALAACSAVAAVSFLSLLWVLDLQYTTFTNPISHSRYMLGYANHLRLKTGSGPGVATAAGGPGLAQTSSPVLWLANRKPIVYYQRNARKVLRGPFHTRILFQGRISPVIIFLAIPALVVAFVTGRRGDGASRLAVAWFAGTFLPFVLLDVRHHPSYLHYMLIVLPSVYLGIAKLISSPSLPKALLPLYGVALAYGLWALYPIRVWS